MRRSQRVFLLFGLSAAAVLGAMAWITQEVIRLDDLEREARIEARRGAAMRIGLRTIDQTLAGWLSTATALPLSMEPVLGGRSGEAIFCPQLDYLRFNFRIGAKGRIDAVVRDATDLRDGTLRPLGAQPTVGLRVEGMAAADPAAHAFAERLEIVRRAGSAAFYAAFDQELRPAAPVVAQTSQSLQYLAANPTAQVVESQPDASQAGLMNGVQTLQPDVDNFDYNQRVISNLQSQYANNAMLNRLNFGTNGGSVSEFRPRWIALPGAAEKELFLLRLISGQTAEMQGLWIDWPTLSTWLLSQSGDLGAPARLEPLVEKATLDSPGVLASLPARLELGPWPAARDDRIGPKRAILWIGWAAVLAAVGSAGWVLAKAVSLGERRGRFVSVVTHELRTPLTTFRLYAQMLAEGMVKDESARREYVETLRAESERLSRVVESVLLYSRLENDSAAVRRERIAVGALLDRVQAPLAARAAEAGMNFSIDDHAHDAVLEVDPQAIEQAIVNLVDNAAKYAAGAADKRILLEARRDGRNVRLTVRDFGPGIAASQSSRLFRPFERGREHAAGTIPGVGLGLAVAAGLVRAHGGALVLTADGSPGAAFTITLPAAFPS